MTTVHDESARDASPRDASLIPGAAAHSALITAIEGGRVGTFEPTGNDAIDALLACADATGTQVEPERISAAVRVRPVSADHAARALGMAVRPVDLSRDSTWWRSDAENLAVRWEGQWCAVVPQGGRQHIKPPGRPALRVNEAIAAAIEPAAFGVIPVLGDGKRTLMSAWKLGWAAGGKRDIAAIVLLAAAAMVLGTLVPIVSGTIIGELVPTGEINRIFVVTFILMLAGFLSAFIVVGQSIIAQRMSGRFNLRLTAAFYERVFRLRSSFHREHMPGELAGRLAGVEGFSAGIAMAVPTVVSLGALLLASALVLSQVSIALSIAVLLLSVLVLVVAGVAIPKFLRDAENANDLSLELGGTTFSILGGIAKIRTAGAEQRMLDRWLFRFARQQAWSRDQGRRAVVLGVISTIPASLIPLMLVLVEVAGLGNLSLGAFTTATAASAQAAGAIAGLIPVALTIASLVPILKALRPILEAEPDPRGSAAGDPGELSGDVALENVTFEYEPGAPVLSSINLHIPAGSMTAIVGPSGSGKSTIVRLLLGLEEPTSGEILFDGRALESMDRSAVLSQMGIVPQDAALTPGSILENILASAVDADEEAAWRAAERAGLDADIRAMPMGMQTVISDGASTFSGGQRQRIMIARALVHDPRILVLDEATSALDNRTQEQVGRSVAALGATRIVIAHRLSTIKMADQIVVLDQGRVAEVGTYESLMQNDGIFAQLAARQLT